MTRPKRILFVQQLLGAFGGAERYVELLLPALRKRGVEPSVALFGAGTLSDEGLRERVNRSLAPVRVEQGAATPWGVRSAVHQVRPELIHWNMPDPFLFRGGLWAALHWHVPSVLTDHLPMMRDGAHYELVRRGVNRRVAGIIVVSESAEAEARRHWRRLPPVAVVRNGVEVASTRARTPPRGGDVRLLFLGRLERQKRPDFAVAVLGALRERGTSAVLRLVGEGSGRDSIEEAVRAHGLDDAVELARFVEDPTPALLGAHVLLAPAEFEGLPFAPVEALATGLPVLASDIAPHREIARECGGLRMLPVTSAAGAWAVEIERMLPELRRLSEAAIAGGQAFSVDRMADETLAAYERFLT